MTLTKTTTAKVAGVVAGVGLVLAMAFSFATPAYAALTESQIQSILSLLQSFGADQSTINNVDASLRGQPTTGTGSTGSTGSASCSQFTRDLTDGSTGADVQALQVILNANGAQVAASGAGSPGNETTYFGSLTKSALAKWQAANGVSPAVGYFGPITRAALASSGACGAGTGTGTGTGTTVPAGSGLTIAAGSQPQNALAPKGASRVPFTTFTVTAGNDGAVTMNSVTIQRTGLGQNAAFAGVVLLDSNGTQLGNAKTLNSNDQATIGEAVTIPAGQSRTFTVAGNMASSLTSYAGEAPALSVIAVNTSATVSGSLPITGAFHTINATLTIGTATANVSTFDPNTSQTKEIGSTGIRFAGIRVTAGSGEDIRIRSIRWNQTGSAGSTDINNVVTMVDGVAYPTTLSADGDYYSTTFGSGLVVGKGNNVDIYVMGDIVSGTSRTVVFDIDESTDLHVTGEKYGYGITPSAGSTASASSSSSQFTTGTPWFDASHLTISAGSATTIQKASSVAAQNVAINVPDQPLGGFTTDFKGEPVTITQIDFGFTITGGPDASDLTNVSLVDQNGSVVAGPQDGTASGVGTNGYVRFTDSITFPTGMMTYTLRGKLSTDFANGDTIIASTSPTANWSNPKGDVTGDTVTLSQGTFNMNTMTVKAAALDISVSPSPVAQNIVAGVQGFTFANFQLDATQSGEDVRFSSMPAKLTFATMTANELTNCQLFDGATALNTGSNVVNPASSVTTGSDVTFTFDQSLTVAKGTVKTLALKCNLSSSVSTSDTVSWGIQASPSISVTGVTSSNDVTETVTASVGQTMTVQAGTLVASEDSSSPSYAIVKAGSTGVTNGIINFRASNEDVTISRIGLQLTNTASSSASDLVKVSLWDGATKIGEATFTGSNTNATSTLSTPLVVPKDTDKDVTVKIDLANVGTSQSGTQGALIAVDVDTAGTNTQGVGSSGTTINATGSTSFSGTRMFSSYPTVAKLSVPSTTLSTGTEVSLYRFSVTASSGGNGVGLAEVTVNIATSTGSATQGTTTVTNLEVYAYTDANFSTPVSGFTNGQVVATVAGLVSSGDNAAALSSILQIPAGATYYFDVIGDTTLTAGTGTFSGSVTTRLAGDAAYPVLSGLMGASATVQADTNDDFVWSPNATTTSAAGHIDWTNGYFVPGLPSNGSDAVTISK